MVDKIEIMNRDVDEDDDENGDRWSWTVMVVDGGHKRKQKRIDRQW